MVQDSKTLFLLVVFIIINSLGNLISQNVNQQEIDSLESLLIKVNDSEKIDVLNKLSNSLYLISPEKSLEYAYQALLIADSLSENTKKPKTLNNIGIAYEYLEKFDSAEYYYHSALETSVELNDSGGISAALNNLGILNEMQSNYRDALKFYRRALQIRLKQGNKYNIAGIYYNMGSSHLGLGDYNLSIEYYHDALEVYEELKDTLRISRTLGNLGLVYDKLLDYDKALEYYQISLLMKDSTDKYGISTTLNNIASLHLYKEDYQKALENYNTALKILIEIDYKRGISGTLNNIGLIYENQGNLDMALVYYLESLATKEEIGHKHGMANALSNIGVIYTKKRAFNKAISFLLKAHKIAKEINAKEVIKDSYKNLSDLYYKKGDYKKACEYLNLYSDLKDTLFTEETNKKIAEMQVKYNTEQMENEINLLQTEKKIKNLELKSKQEKIKILRIRNVTFLFGLVLLIALAIIIYRLYIYKKNANQLIELRNRDILRQKEVLEEKMKLIKLDNIELKKLSIAVSETDNSIIILDTEGCIEWVNKGFSTLTGFTLEEFVKTRGINFKKSSTKKNISQIFQNCIDNKKSEIYTTYIFRKDGSRIWVKTNVTPILDNEGTVVKFVIVTADITSEKDKSLSLSGRSQYHFEKAASEFNKLKKLELPEELSSQIHELIVETKKHKTRFLMYTGNQQVPISVDDIAYFYTELKIVYVISKENIRYNINSSLDLIENQLDPKYFFRANRQFIVSIDSIKRIHNYFRKLIIELIPPTKDVVSISKNKSIEFKRWVNEDTV